LAIFLIKSVSFVAKTLDVVAVPALCALYSLFESGTIKASVGVKESSVETGPRSRFCNCR